MYRKSWAPRPQQLETPRLTLGKIRRETSLEPESVPQQSRNNISVAKLQSCHQLTKLTGTAYVLALTFVLYPRLRKTA